MYSALICGLHQVVHDAEKFKLLCKVLLLEDTNKELTKSMQTVYCILKCETDIIQQVNYEMMYPILKEEGFDFTHYEQNLLQEEKNVQCIIDILKDKEFNYFDLFLSCLQQHWPTISDKIESEMNNLNCTLIVYNNPPSYTSNVCTSEKLISFRSDLIETYTGQSFQNSFAGLDNEYTFIFPTLSKYDNEESINHKNIFNEDENCVIVPSCLEIFNKGHRVVLLQGSPGSGKTTIAYKICKEWADGKLGMFSYVIVMHLEDHRIARCKTIEEFLELLIGNVEGNRVALEIRKIHGEGVLLILEGWDHLLPEQRRHSLFTDLVKGKLFPKAVIVITSRPSACVSLPYQFINCKILVFGFTKTQVDEYISCKDHPEGTLVAQKFRSQLTDFQWHVPANLCIILSILKQVDIKSSPSVTELYKMFVLYLLNRHKEDVYGDNSRIKHFATLSTELPPEMFNMLQSLAKMAFMNLLQNNVTFDEEEIRKYCFASKKFPLHFDGMGLLQVVNSICLYVDRSYQFTHQSLQELLAAWYFSQRTLHYQQQHLKLLDYKEMFLPFYNDFANHHKPSSKSSNCTIC